MAHRTAGWCSPYTHSQYKGGARGGGGSLERAELRRSMRGLPGRSNGLPKLEPRSSGSFTGRYERARRALRAERRTALLGFPLPAAQRIDARYEKTYRAVAEKPPSRVRVVVGKGRYIWHTAPQVGAPLHSLTTQGGAGVVVGRSNEPSSAANARPAWPPQWLT